MDPTDNDLRRFIKSQRLKLFIDGVDVPMETSMDQLTKDILFPSKDQPALQVGAWDRGFGFKGGSVDDILVYDRVLTPFEIKVIAQRASWSDLLAQSNDLSEAALNEVKEYYLTVVDPDLMNARKELGTDENNARRFNRACERVDGYAGDAEA
jgi:hypothetical protein